MSVRQHERTKRAVFCLFSSVSAQVRGACPGFCPLQRGLSLRTARSACSRPAFQCSVCLLLLPLWSRQPPCPPQPRDFSVLSRRRNCFRAIVRPCKGTFHESYRKFAPGVDKAWFRDVFPKPPFVAYTQVPVSGRSSGYNFFIALPELLSNKNVLLWDFETDGEISDSSTSVRWKVARSATPVLYK